jgi:hypothetical protein
MAVHHAPINKLSTQVNAMSLNLLEASKGTRCYIMADLYVVSFGFGIGAVL